MLTLRIVAHAGSGPDLRNWEKVAHYEVEGLPDGQRKDELRHGVEMALKGNAGNPQARDNLERISAQGEGKFYPSRMEFSRPSGETSLCTASLPTCPTGFKP